MNVADWFGVAILVVVGFLITRAIRSLWVPPRPPTPEELAEARAELKQTRDDWRKDLDAAANELKQYGAELHRKKAALGNFADDVLMLSAVPREVLLAELRRNRVEMLEGWVRTWRIIYLIAAAALIVSFVAAFLGLVTWFWLVLPGMLLFGSIFCLYTTYKAIQRVEMSDS